MVLPLWLLKFKLSLLLKFEMLVILRINRKFMQYMMKKHYPRIVLPDSHKDAYDRASKKHKLNFDSSGGVNKKLHSMFSKRWRGRWRWCE